MSNQNSPSTADDRIVWYQLISASDGRPFMGVSVEAILIRKNALMFEVRDEISAKHPIRFKH